MDTQRVAETESSDKKALDRICPMYVGGWVYIGFCGEGERPTEAQDDVKSAPCGTWLNPGGVAHSSNVDGTVGEVSLVDSAHDGEAIAAADESPHGCISGVVYLGQLYWDEKTGEEVEAYSTRFCAAGAVAWAG